MGPRPKKQHSRRTYVLANQQIFRYNKKKDKIVGGVILGDIVKIDFNDPASVRDVIKTFHEGRFLGKNKKGEEEHINVFENGIVLTTMQEDGQIRINYYKKNGEPDGVKMDGRWK